MRKAHCSYFFHQNHTINKMESTLIQQKIFEIRGQKVMLDFDLAVFYSVQTKVLNQAVNEICCVFQKISCFNFQKPSLTT